MELPRSDLLRSHLPSPQTPRLPLLPKCPPKKIKKNQKKIPGWDSYVCIIAEQGGYYARWAGWGDDHDDGDGDKDLGASKV